MTKKTQDITDLIEPLFENVFIEPTDYKEELGNGLIGLPPKDGEKPLIGIVRAISTKSYFDKGLEITPQLSVKVGDKVLYRKWSMSELKHEGKELIVVGQKDIAAILHF